MRELERGHPLNSFDGPARAYSDAEVKAIVRKNFTPLGAFRALLRHRGEPHTLRL